MNYSTNALCTFIAIVVISGGLACLNARYGIFIPPQRRYLRYNAFYTDDFWASFAHERAEQPFSVIEYPSAAPLTDKVIVYSLYGTNTKRYFTPLYRNIVTCKEKLPGWHFRIYIHAECRDWIAKLRMEETVQLFIVEDPCVVSGNSAGAFWRLLVLCEDINAVILDADDVLNPVLILKQWERLHASDAGLMVRQCNPWPHTHICADGIYKKKTTRLPYPAEVITHYKHRSTFGSDEVFLTLEVGPALKQTIIWESAMLSGILGSDLKGRGLL